MNETLAKAYELERDEKLTPVFVYTDNLFVRGEVITKESMRVSTWLRTAAMPEYVHLLKAQALIFGAGTPLSASFHEMLIPTAHVLAFHLQPPAKDPIDYDETEQNRKMEPATLLIGTFRIFGHVRMAAQLDLAKNLDVNRSMFMSFYDAEISNPTLANMGVIRVPMLLVRPAGVNFCLKTA
ncbi:MAG: hypothetical protein ACOYYS_05805 [Chloroflexota bacterium]